MNRFKVRPKRIIAFQCTSKKIARRKVIVQKRQRNYKLKTPVEINTTLLAEEIAEVKAVEEKRLEKEKTQHTKIGIWKSLWFAVKHSEGQVTSALFAAILEAFFILLSITAFLFFCAGINVIIQNVMSMSWSGWGIVNNIWNMLSEILLNIIVLAFSGLLLLAGREVGATKDKNFIVNVFSGVVGLAALIVALVTLSIAKTH